MSTNKKPHIAALMMVKNETKRLSVTLKSIEGHVDSLVVFDTGSTDDTITILKEWSKKTGIPLRLKEGEFVDFSTSRNIALDFADSFDDVDFLLMCDCNDELQGGDNLRKFAESQMTTENTGYLMCQHWWSGQFDKYFNMRFVKARTGWRYRGSVHEWMKDTSSKTSDPSFPVVKMPDNIVLYQDRTADDDKTGKRFSRDRLLLLKDHKNDPTEPRTIFYLAQTCACLGLNEEAFYYYKIRSTLEGFQEEKFHAFLRCGDLSKILNHSWYDTLAWYTRAMEHTPRAEPLNKLTQYYISVKNWFLAYSFIRISCELEYPHHCILFVDKRAYDYERWHLMGISAYYAGRFEDGKKGCLKAIESGVNKELDTNNLQFYLNREKSSQPETKVNQPQNYMHTKKEFIDSTIIQLKKENPDMNDRKLRAKASLLWKLRKK